MRDHLNGNGVEIIDISPMGCRTGFYMSLIGTPDEQRVADAESGDGRCAEGERSEPDPGAQRLPVRDLHHALAGRGPDIARHIIERDVRINSNDELALPKEKLQELHI